MSSTFFTYFRLGFSHILDFAAYDHMLFLLALLAIYQVHQWKNVLTLVTAFTIGHSVTLALASLQIFSIPGNIVEFLIPVTILLTAIFNVIEKKPEDPSKRSLWLNYGIAMFFGLIHGMGFSNQLRGLLGEAGNIFLPLLSFNVGLEIGQILIVAVIFGVNYLLINWVNVKHREWNLLISGAATGISLILMAQNKFW